MRGRCWRRYKIETIMKKRINVLVQKGSYFFEDANKRKIRSASFSDYISTNTFNLLKKTKTDRYVSRYKYKYSHKSNSMFGYYSNIYNTRTYNKKVFNKILKENGFK